ncbi:MAG: hypothetical protein QM658_18170 [Gordonia sp. (in: high G+C Gram-positive bacteria)]
MTAGARTELVVQTLSGFLLGVMTTFFLLVRVGGAPFPIAIAAAALGNTLLLKLASDCTRSAWRFAPLAAWGLVTLVGMMPGIAGNGALLDGPWLLLLMVLGFGTPAIASAWIRPLD